jgi:glycosyltransferase involved in cell wall biosynthesis
MKIDVLYLARNRLAFTQTTFGLLLENTDWDIVDRLVVYDDGSTDSTRGWLRRACMDAPMRVEFRATNFGSPVQIMLDYLDDSTADVFAKIDNDIAVPSGWLDPSVSVLEEFPEVDLLGLAAGWTGTKDGEPGYEACSHIGGVGLMRTDAFRRYPGLWGNGRQGFTQWQHANTVVSGWITPDLPVVQLDLIPDEPWRSLAKRYVARGWAREWPPYAETSREWWDWIPKP